MNLKKALIIKTGLTCYIACGISFGEHIECSVYGKNPRVRTWWFKNLLTDIFHFKTQRYENVLS